MALVMAAESEEIDFRCLVANICDRLSGDEIRRIVYIWLFSKKERLKDANGLDIFSELEYADILSPAKPEGLLAVVEEIGNKKVANTIKDFIKKRRKQVSGKPAPPRARPRAETAPSTMPDTHLQTCYKVALGQMNLLLQQLEVLRQAAKAGDQEGDEAQQAVEKISSTATGLARRLKSKRARKQIGLPRSQSGSSTGSSSASDTQGDYGNFLFVQHVYICYRNRVCACIISTECMFHIAHRADCKFTNSFRSRCQSQEASTTTSEAQAS